MEKPYYDFEVPAPQGQVWVCGACGKRSKSKSGFGDAIDHGWDESCFLNSILCYEEGLILGSDGRVDCAQAVNPDERSDAA